MPVKENPIDEYLDLVDENDNIIGQKKRSEIYAKNLFNFRVINAFLINSLGKLWIPRRTKSKKIYPLFLDMSLGGHVESGETYEQAFKRELKEELNLNITQISYNELGKLTPQGHGVSAFMKIYEIRYDKTPNYNKNDFIEYFWLYPYEVIHKLNNGDKGKSDLLKLINLFYN